MEFFAPAMNIGQAFWLACMGPAHAFRGQGYRVREPSKRKAADAIQAKRRQWASLRQCNRYLGN